MLELTGAGAMVARVDEGLGTSWEEVGPDGSTRPSPRPLLARLRPRQSSSTRLTSRETQRVSLPPPLATSSRVADGMASKTTPPAPPALAVPARFGIVECGVFRSNTPKPLNVRSLLYSAGRL